MEILALLLMLWTIASLCETEKVDYGPECEYNGDIRFISVENCIAKMENDGNTERCKGVVYGPGTMYRQRIETPFWIEIKPRDRPKYPDDLTYKILTMDEDYNLKQIRGCESMRLNDPGECVLPPLKEGEINYIYLPLKDSEYSYCYYDIDEHEDGAIDFCDENETIETSCYKLMKDGRYTRIKPFNAVDSRLNYPKPIEFCFFPTPEIYINKTRIRNDENIHHNINSEETGSNVFALLGGKKVKCTIVETQNFAEEPAAKFAPDYHNGTSNYVCYFIRAKTEKETWSKNARCLEVELEDDITLKVILAVAFSLLLALATVVAAVSLYRTDILCFKSKKMHKVFRKSLAINLNYCPDPDEECSVSDKGKEIPYKITFETEESSQYPNQGSFTTRGNSHQTNEEQTGIPCTASETASDCPTIESDETDTVDHELYHEQIREPDGDFRTSMMTDNPSPHDMPDECTDVGHYTKKYFDRDTDSQGNVDKQSLAQEDEKNAQATGSSFDPEYVSKDTKTFTYIKTSKKNHQYFPDDMVTSDYVLK